MFAATAFAFLLAAQAAEPARPREPRVGNLAQYVGPDDYPAEAMRRGQQGTVRFVVAVGTNGRVTNCTITRSSGHEQLDAGTCRLARARLRFNPGRIRGRPAEMSAMPFGITWTLPGVAGSVGPDGD
ncbi:MAG TPA: energy transducer TonB [Allosphingosinicella sp.]|nr:energy transducer TonB [Allosphingosinicella sp.]